MSSRWVARVLVLGLVIAVAGCASSTAAREDDARDGGDGQGQGQGQGHGDGHGHGHGHGSGERGAATVTHRFEDPERWAKRFEDPGRDEWQEPDRVIGFCDVTEETKLADIGSATGYFPVRFAKHVGLVYGVDVEPGLVNYLNLRVHREGIDNVVSLVCAYEDPRIPEPVDVIFICDTFHHIDGRIDYFANVKKYLAEGGRLVVVDFKKGDFPVGPKDDGHKLAAETVIDELAEAGWKLVKRLDLKYQYCLAFVPAE